MPRVDIILDDGGHKPQHQNATLIGAFPHLSPGGVYLCEDVHKPGNEHANFVWRNFVDGKDGINDTPSEFAAKGRRASYVQQYAAEVSFYPYIVFHHLSVASAPRQCGEVSRVCVRTGIKCV